MLQISKNFAKLGYFLFQGASPHRSGWQQARPGGGAGGNQGGGGGGGEEVALLRPHGNRCQGEGGDPGCVRGVPGGGGQAGGEEAGKHEEAEEGGGREEEKGKMQRHVMMKELVKELVLGLF